MADDLEEDARGLALHIVVYNQDPLDRLVASLDAVPVSLGKASCLSD